MSIRVADLERVRQLPLFRDSTPEAVLAVTANGFLQKFPTGTTLLTEGDPVDFLYVLLDGGVELEGTWNDKETVLAVLRPVSTFILAAVVLEAGALMSARTIERSDILMLPGDALRKAMRHDAMLALAVAQEVSGSYRSLVRTIKNQKLRGGAERLANYLISQRLSQGGDPTFTLPHEKRVLASLLGMTPENLSRAFATLTDYGVTVNGPKVTIHRPVVLERLAKPDPLIDNPIPLTGEALSDAAREAWPAGLAS